MPEKDLSKKASEIKENIKAYQETCNAIRHYSNLSYNTRILAIVQGFILTGAWIVNYKDTQNDTQVFISSLGIIFTILLSLFHYGYFYAAAQFYEMASNMEEILFEGGFRPFQDYSKRHAQKYNHIAAKIFILYAPFTLTAIIFTTIFIWSIMKKN